MQILIFMAILAWQFLRKQLALLRLDTLLSLLLFCGPPRFTEENGGLATVSNFDPSLLVQIAVFIAAGIYLVFRWRPKLALVQWLTVLPLAAFLLSAIRSEQPAYTVFRAYQAAVLFAFSAMFIAKHGKAEYLRWLGRAALLACLFLIAWLLVNPLDLLQALGGFLNDFRFSGSTILPAGEVGIILFVVALAEKNRLRWLMLALSSTFIFSSFSRAAWACALIAMLLASFWRVWSTRWCRLALAGIALTVFVTNSLTSVASVRQIDNLTDLTGRDLLWASMISTAQKESPWIGLGHSYASHMLASEFDPQFGGGHSVFVDAFVGSGLVGLALVVMLTIAILWKAARLPRNQDNFASCALVLVIVGLSTVSGANIDVGPFAFAYWALPSLVIGPSNSSPAES